MMYKKKDVVDDDGPFGACFGFKKNFIKKEGGPKTPILLHFEPTQNANWTFC